MNKNIDHSEQVLVVDIGGTNANFGIISYTKGTYTLIEYYQIKSQGISDFTASVKSIIQAIAQEKHISFSVIVIGIAAPVYENMHSIKPTHLPFSIDKSDLIAQTGILNIFFINDFISVACGYDLVKDTLPLTSLPINPHSQKAFIGAGTGLGQAFSVWSKRDACAIPFISEGGHIDFSPTNMFDYDFHLFIKHRLAQQSSVTWEHILSGNGISLLYEFLGSHYDYTKTDISQEIEEHNFQPDFISRYADHDERSKHVFACYKDYYARFARQVALESVCYGGLYIAGGIAAKNKKLFLDRDFLRIFTDHPRHRGLLEKIPIFLIQDYKVSLYGAAHYYRQYLMEIV